MFSRWISLPRVLCATFFSLILRFVARSPCRQTPLPPLLPSGLALTVKTPSASFNEPTWRPFSCPRAVVQLPRPLRPLPIPKLPPMRLLLVAQQPRVRSALELQIAAGARSLLQAFHLLLHLLLLPRLPKEHLLLQLRLPFQPHMLLQDKEQFPQQGRCIVSSCWEAERTCRCCGRRWPESHKSGASTA